MMQAIDIESSDKLAAAAAVAACADELRAKKLSAMSSKRTTTTTTMTARAFWRPLLLTALVSTLVGYCAGLATGFFVAPVLPAPVLFDIDAEVLSIRATCTEADLTGEGDEVSEACQRLVADRVRALEELTHTHPDRAAKFVNATRGAAGTAARRKLWGSGGRGSTTRCDGEWSGSCCRDNRPGPATGPSPLCRGGLMNGCGCDPITGVCQQEYYECSWWNGFCHLFCGSYDEVRYCNYCGNE